MLEPEIIPCVCLGNSIKESSVREMSEVKVPVVIWGMKDKRIETCMVGIDTTFADVIEKMNLKGVENALMGHEDVPFKLLPCDFVPGNHWQPGDRIPFECKAENFESITMSVYQHLSCLSHFYLYFCVKNCIRFPLGGTSYIFRHISPYRYRDTYHLDNHCE